MDSHNLITKEERQLLLGQDKSRRARGTGLLRRMFVVALGSQVAHLFRGVRGWVRSITSW